MMSDLFDDYQAFNKYQVFDGMRVNSSGTKPSVYISEIKLKKAFQRLLDGEIEDLYDKEMSAIAIERHREKLSKKVEDLLEWQLFKAIEILMQEDNYHAANFVLLCNKSRRNTNSL